MNTRTGFLALTGLPTGALTVSRGLGYPGTGEPAPLPPSPVENELLGVRAPQAVVENLEAPTAVRYEPRAKKKRRGP